MSEPRKRPFPRPLGRREEDGSYGTVGGWVVDAETRRKRRPIVWGHLALKKGGASVRRKP